MRFFGFLMQRYVKWSYMPAAEPIVTCRLLTNSMLNNNNFLYLVSQFLTSNI